LKDAPVLNYLELASTPLSNATAQSSVMDVFLMINQLSFSHIIELLKADSVIKRDFYAIQAIQNGWSVRELQRAINSMLFERTGLSRVSLNKRH
jgi:hypothetical protein